MRFVDLWTVTTFFSVTEQKLGWNAAQSFCQGRNGSLAVVADDVDNSIIHTMTADLNASFWIGLYENTSSWTWSLNASRSQLVQPWETSQPESISSLKQCASVTSSSLWRIHDCTSFLPFFCNRGKKCRARVCLFLLLKKGLLCS